MSVERRHGLLGGRVRLAQPAKGYRVGVDPVLLAAAVPAKDRETVVDLGAGAGAAALCLAARVAHVRVVGIERDRPLTAMAEGNAEATGVAARTRFVCADIRDAAGFRAMQAFAPCHHAMTNPPFLPPERAAPHCRNDAATVEDGAGIADWVAAALSLLRPKGSLTVIYRADRMAELLAALSGRAGDILVWPLWPKRGRPAKRVLVRARKQTRGPSRLMPGMVLHEPDGRYSAQAEAVLGHAAPLELAANPD